MFFITHVMTDLDRYYAYLTEYLSFGDNWFKSGYERTPMGFYAWVCSAISEYEDGSSDTLSTDDEFAYNFVVAQLERDPQWLTSPQASVAQ